MNAMKEVTTVHRSVRIHKEVLLVRVMMDSCTTLQLSSVKQVVTQAVNY